MTRVDFYILNSTGSEARLRFACRLVEKAWTRQHRVYIHTPDAPAANAVDMLLWTFRAGSFLPHQLSDTAPTDCPVLIGHGNEPVANQGVLVNLDEEVPLFFSRFERVVEIINQDENVRQSGRNRFKFYRDRGYDLHSHTLDG